MTDNPKRRDDLAPELDNAEQEDEAGQAQTVAEDALIRGMDAGLEDSRKATSGDESDDVQDLVERMEQMASSGTIDMDAFRGEPHHDDEDETYGRKVRDGDEDED